MKSIKKHLKESLGDDYLLFGILLSILLRWLVTLYPYSGAGTPPKFGDYEAQRHWMEITYNIPISDWYYNTTENDLTYWGLDYPPLTAYHSWLNGFISSKVNSSWVDLGSSRGMESYDHKLFMRYSVLVCDLLIYFPAVWMYWELFQPTLIPRDKAVALTTMLMYPGLNLIDYGHFQYNCFSLGLTIWAIVCLKSNHDLIACAFFTLSLSYKQMELYHAFPMFFYLLGEAYWGRENCVWKVLKLGLAVLGTFVVCWFPFLPHLPQVLNRLFPIARGIFEDKVSNFWCSMNIFIKFRNFITTPQLALICAGVTLLAVLPSSVHLFLHPNTKTFKLSLANVSLAFFLFSFHVHEKSILLAAIPISLLLEDYPISSTWFLIISTISMFPLLAKEGLIIPLFTLTVIYLVSCYNLYWTRLFESGNKQAKSCKRWLPSVMALSILGSMIISISSLIIAPPPRYPDLFPVLISVYSFVHFGVFFLYFNYAQLSYSSQDVSYTKLKSK